MNFGDMTPEQQHLYESIEAGPSRARLEPHREVILRWRREGRSYRCIQHTLAANGITIRLSALYRFIKRRSRPRTATSVPSEFPPPNQAELRAEVTREVNQMHLRSRADMVGQRESIRAMYKKVTFVDETPKKEFVFDPNQPLINKNY